jgi:hypothetical protein
MLPGGWLAAPAVRTAAHLRIAQWDAILRDPERLKREQTNALLASCREASGTDFGLRHALGGVRSYPDFRERVPVRTYADLEPEIERMLRGEENVLWPGRVRYFGNSSGTSSTKAQSKFLPISERQIRWQQRAGFDVVARHVVQSGDASLFGGFPLGLFPPSTLKERSPGVYVTNNPGLMQLHIPAPLSWASLPRPPLRDVPDYDQKLSAVAAAYLDHDVRSLSGTTCWFSIFFDRVLAAAREQGRRERTVGEIWPNLHVLFGGGINAEPYRKLIAERMGRPITLIDNYNATEGGIFAATDRPADPGMAMIPDRGTFFEFVPTREHGKPGARRVPLWDVEPGEEYAVLLSTPSGLFGYSIGDAIRFTEVFPHRMEFCGRLAGMLSLTQELTTALEVERAVASAMEELACTVVDFGAAPDVGVQGTAKGRYLLFAEFERAPADLAGFARAFDRGLSAQNRVYREHRSADVGILPPAVALLPRGGTQRFLREMGATSTQQKFPRILDERKRDLLLTLSDPPLGG